MNEKKEIIINLSETNRVQKYKKDNELFQIEAFKKVTKILREHYNPVDDEDIDIVDCRFHDTIFIDGDRGVGKTAFFRPHILVVTHTRVTESFL